MKRISLIAAAAAILLAGCTQKQEQGQWSPEKAQAWYDGQGWLAGCDYIPADAINQIEMWSDSTYNHDLIDKELGWAQGIGFKTLRVYLSSIVYENDPQGLKDRMDDFIGICREHSIRPLFVFFDDCWNPDSQYGKQPEPKSGIHNSGWVQDPPVPARADTLTLFPKLETYVKDILTTFGDDDRILLWDLYNEPGNSWHLDSSLPLLKNVFRWAQEIRPSQPISAGLWNHDLKTFNDFQLRNSDVTTYHNYSGDPECQQNAIDTLRTYGRPIICTEYMARTKGCTFQMAMPILKQNNVAAINWGFVAGKTNTIFAWDTPLPYITEPEVWFHDIFRQDGTPFSEEEIATIKELTGVRN
ncbi:MAG: cellulase family glycosylhydrolase [Bacteroidales bacterium]|uniref:cellulase family glycosylhydrolase n=1 Tax=Candidatus Cryptobacteroides sp. TaxID=2952915 RepID=UPI002A75007F|nr:cellulase family glycosylhydrolase [Candidatus Cryptobacteroides sp.]MDD7234210.1 cellulase family glycosylhydrolase [Bacteroidales bacterium]MDY2701073.1 cellulase family glycosylhydrolase [Candidatus Cryptobacteroides sp.]